MGESKGTWSIENALEARNVAAIQPDVFIIGDEFRASRGTIEDVGTESNVGVRMFCAAAPNPNFALGSDDDGRGIEVVGQSTSY